jgi:hypothetical protein
LGKVGKAIAADKCLSLLGAFARIQLRRNRKKKLIVCRINDADEHRSARSTLKAVALEATLVDGGLIAPTEGKLGVAFWTSDLLQMVRFFDKRRHGRFFGHHTPTSIAL